MCQFRCECIKMEFESNRIHRFTLQAAHCTLGLSKMQDTNQNFSSRQLQVSVETTKRWSPDTSIRNGNVKHIHSCSYFIHCKSIDAPVVRRQIAKTYKDNKRFKFTGIVIIYNVGTMNLFELQRLSNVWWLFHNECMALNNTQQITFKLKRSLWIRK